MTEPKLIPLPNGLTTRWLDVGSAADAPPILLVHGLAASIEIWEPVMPILAAHRRVVAFDLPGFGEAEKPDAAYDPAFFVAQLAAALDHLSAPRCHLVGSSMGASLLVRAAPTLGHRFASATLLAPGGFGRRVHPFLRVPTVPGLGSVLATPSRAANAFAVRLAVANPAVDTGPLVALQDRLSRLPGAKRAFVRTLRGFASPLGVTGRATFEADAQALTTPTLLVWGKQDRIFPRQQSRRAATVLPNLTHTEVLETCGHYPQIDQPEATAALIEDHLASADALSPPR